MEGTTITTASTGAARIEGKEPIAYRLARYFQTGEIRVQGAYAWMEGDDAGVNWRDLPVVDVDQDGNEIEAAPVAPPPVELKYERRPLMFRTDIDYEGCLDYTVSGFFPLNDPMNDGVPAESKKGNWFPVDGKGNPLQPLP